MTLYLILAGAAALLVLIWAVCRTPDGPKRDAENRRASRVADRSSAEAQFGQHPHHGDGEGPGA